MLIFTNWMSKLRRTARWSKLIKYRNKRKMKINNHQHNINTIPPIIVLPISLDGKLSNFHLKFSACLGGWIFRSLKEISGRSSGAGWWLWWWQWSQWSQWWWCDEMSSNINYQVWMTYFVPSHGPVSVQSSWHCDHSPTLHTPRSLPAARGQSSSGGEDRGGGLVVTSPAPVCRISVISFR